MPFLAAAGQLKTVLEGALDKWEYYEGSNIPINVFSRPEVLALASQGVGPRITRFSTVVRVPLTFSLYSI